MKRKKKSCVFFKVDYEKAYDSVCWEFIFYMLGKGWGFVKNGSVGLKRVWNLCLSRC